MLFKKIYQFCHLYSYCLGFCWVPVSFTLVYKYHLRLIRLDCLKGREHNFCSSKNNLFLATIHWKSMCWLPSKPGGNVTVWDTCNVAEWDPAPHADIHWSNVLGHEREGTVLNIQKTTSRSPLGSGSSDVMKQGLFRDEDSVYSWFINFQRKKTFEGVEELA